MSQCNSLLLRVVRSWSCATMPLIAARGGGVWCAPWSIVGEGVGARDAWLICADAVVQVIIYGFISLVINSVVIYIHIYEHLVQFIYTLRAILLRERDRSRMAPLAHLPSTSRHRVSALSPSLAP
jgi:hypothetical protein